uniref:Uncharacterized protein n=1 Tax=Geospiza parvula TaxID=87175 RepID=A0A8U8CH59_GEOPR
ELAADYPVLSPLKQRVLGIQLGFSPWTPQRGRRVPSIPDRAGEQAEGQAETVSQETPIAELLISIAGWWEWKVLTNPGEKKDLYCKWVISLVLTTTRELIPLQWLTSAVPEDTWMISY